VANHAYTVRKQYRQCPATSFLFLLEVSPKKILHIIMIERSN
jgi:hypothetical protein